MHVSLNSSTAAFSPQKQQRQEGVFSPSSAHIRARFTAPTLNNTGNSPLATGNSSTSRNSYQTQHGTVPIDPIGLGTRYGSSLVSSPRSSGITSEGARQAVNVYIFLNSLCIFIKKKFLAIKTFTRISNSSKS